MSEGKDILDNGFGFLFDQDIEGNDWLGMAGRGGEDDMFGPEDALSVDSGAFLPNDEGRSEFLAPDPDKVPVIESAMKQDSEEYKNRPAIERTRELLGYMRPQRVVLLGIVEAACEPISSSAIAEKIEQLREHKFSVYDPSNLCTMLEQAGALERITEDGEPYVHIEPEPDIVVVDGVEYYQPTYPPAVFWQASAAGLEALDENDPEERLDRLFVSEAELLPVYKSVLEMICAEGGAAMTALSGGIDNVELIAKPRRFFVQHFVENLERCEAAAWDGATWKATDLGHRALAEKLAEVDGAEITPVNPDGTLSAPGAIDGRMITETQGVSW